MKLIEKYHTRGVVFRRVRTVFLCFYLVLNLLYPIKVSAQSSLLDNVSLDINYQKGVILPEYQFVNYITKDYCRSLELSILKSSTGKTYWEQLFNYPQAGVALRYSDLGNSEVLGQEYSLSAFFRIDIVKKKKFRFYNQTGAGLGYVTRKFDLDENYMNVAVGSHLNIHFNTRFGLGYLVGKKTEFNMGLTFNHFSNANMREPNLGINSISVYGGVNYAIGRQTEKQHTEIPIHIKKNYWELFLSFGGKHTRALSSKKYFTSSIAVEYKHAAYRFFHIGAGLDLFYDSSIEDQLNELETEYSSSNRFLTGIHIAPIFVYDKLNIIIQQGVYIGLTEKVDGYSFYNRGIIKFWLNDRLSVRIAMKSHLHILDFPEMGIGLKF